MNNHYHIIRNYQQDSHKILKNKRLLKIFIERLYNMVNNWIKEQRKLQNLLNKAQIKYINK
jgi:hypothetical protein